MFKKSILAIMIAVVCIGAFAQKVDEVTLTVSSDAPTKDEATKLALRSAIEQAFGVFVSANTTILNDELVKDEIATVASGNIRKYDEIASVTLPNGNTSVTLRAVVSLSRLTSYAQSKGSSAEFAGQTLAMNMKLYALNKTNEETAIKNMLELVETLATEIFDYNIKLGEPKVDNNLMAQGQTGTGFSKADYGMVIIPVEIIINPNQNARVISDIIGNTLLSLSMSSEEQAGYKQSGMQFYELGRVSANVTTTVVKKVPQTQKVQEKKKIVEKVVMVDVQEDITKQQVGLVILRNDMREYLGRFFNAIVQFEKFNFKIVDNLDNSYKFNYILRGRIKCPRGTDNSYFNPNYLQKNISTEIKREVPQPFATTFIIPGNQVHQYKKDTEVFLSYISTYVVGHFTGNLFRRVGTWSGSGNSLYREPETFRFDFPIPSSSQSINQINSFSSTTIRTHIVFPPEDLTKYTNFEIMRDED